MNSSFFRSASLRVISFAGPTTSGVNILLTNGAPHYISGEYSGFVLRFREAGEEVPNLKGDEGINWIGKVFRVVGHVDQFLTGLDQIDRTPAEKPDWMLNDVERVERLEAKLAALTNKA
jgi:hypothetical protein